MTDHDAGRRDVVCMSELAVETCWRYVTAEPVGRIAFTRGGRPAVLPVDHVVDDHTIGFRTARGSSLGTLARRQPVAFEVDATPTDRRTGWRVMIAGEIERVDAHARRRIMAPGPQPWASGDRDEWMRIVPSRISGRAIIRRQQQPDGTFLPYMAAE